MNTPIIDITNLSKFYGKTRGIEKVNLQIEEGEVFGMYSILQVLLYY
jgi:ABC-type multidrug transport system ATPase subunit